MTEDVDRGIINLWAKSTIDIVVKDASDRTGILCQFGLHG